MYFVSITRLRVRSLRYLPAFFSANEKVLQQLQRSGGLHEARELIDKKLTFWTLTVWTSEEQMRAFRNSAPHKQAMQKLSDWCSEASYSHFISTTYSPIDWSDAYRNMMENGKLSKVKFPSIHQDEKNFAPIQWTKLSREIKSFLHEKQSDL